LVPLADPSIEALPSEVTTDIRRLESRLSNESAALRAELRASEAALQSQLLSVTVALSSEIDDLRGDLLKWGVLYWIGQAAATGAIVAGLSNWAG
jgi:hypothetical protein